MSHAFTVLGWSGTKDFSDPMNTKTVTAMLRTAPVYSLLVVLGILLSSSFAWCGVVGPSPEQDRINLGFNIPIFNDPNGNLTIRDILSPQIAGNFAPNTTDMIILEGNSAKTWIRLNPGSLILHGSDRTRRVLELGLAELDLAELYVPDSDGADGYRMINGYRGGGGSPENLTFRNYSFQLDGQTDPVKPIYLRLGSFGFNATPVRLWTDGAFRTYTNFDFMIFGMAYGVIACMILYNLFICISLRNETYLAYVMNMLSILTYLLILNGHVFSLINLDGYTIQTMEFTFLGLFMFFSVSFCKRFYDTKANLPRLHWLTIFFQWVGLVIILLGVLGMYMSASIVASAAGVVGPINLIVIGLVRLRQGFAPAKYFIAANISLVAGIMIYVLWAAGLLPLDTHGNLYFTLGPAIESILLSFALADRIRLLEREKATLAYSTARYKKASETDALTGLFNKGYLERRLKKRWPSPLHPISRCHVSSWMWTTSNCSMTPTVTPKGISS